MTNPILTGRLPYEPWRCKHDKPLDVLELANEQPRAEWCMRLGPASGHAECPVRSRAGGVDPRFHARMQHRRLHLRSGSHDDGVHLSEKARPSAAANTTGQRSART